MTTFMSNGKIHKFEFEEENHIYRLDGYQIPSVSVILDMLFPKDFMGPALIQGMSKGKYIHKCCHMDYYYMLNLKKLEPEIKPYIKHFRDFKKKHLDPINCIWEKPSFCSQFLYGFTPDILDTKKYILWDIKTGKKASGKLAERYTLQLMGYKTGLNKLEYKTINILYLSPDGYEIKEVKWDSKLWRMFLMALSVYNFSRR